jgi:hypothetical protein
MLFDSKSNRLTALIGFDSAHIATQAVEYFYSIRTVGALLASPFEVVEEREERQLRQCLLYGFDGNVPDKNGIDVDFEMAQMLDKEFVRSSVLRPVDIQGTEELAALKWFLEGVSPLPETVEKIKASIEENLGNYLVR